MRLIIGLGNPGPPYLNTRHNFGFLTLDYFHDSAPDFSAWENSDKFRALISEGQIDGEKIILAKPQTFMNNSGRAVKLLADFYKLEAADILVLHDDLDLPLGQIRASQNSGAAGHKGVDSIIRELGAQNFIRLRLGIKPENDASLRKGKREGIFLPFFSKFFAPLTQFTSSSSPLTQNSSFFSPLTQRGVGGFKTPSEKFVLQKFTEAERPFVQQATQKAQEAILLILSDGLKAAQNKFN